ncbi:MAG: O-antigen ligase family protein [Holophagales bacterium]|nr:O-antigen ligase family protein [Holophagales bacterium]
MNDLQARVAPLAPGFLLLLFAGWCGTFQGAASWPEGAIGRFVLLAAAALAVGIGDPLRLGRSGRWVLWAAVATAFASAWASPVPRAARTAVALLPALLLLPSAVARAFEGERSRRLALAGCSLATAAIAVAALVLRPLELDARAAMPLGHHNLLAAFLVIALPLVAAGLAERGLGRALAVVALATGGIALLATRSWLGWLAGSATLLAIARVRPRSRKVLAGALLLAWGLLVPRLDAMLRGVDVSAAARSVYARAGWAGIVARPWLGWGTGATPWTLAERLEPRPGVNPPGEVVGTLHSSALELAYEIGLPGALLAAAAVVLFGARTLRASRAGSPASDRRLAECALLALAAGTVMALGNSLLSVPALPVALAVAAGAALAAVGGARGGGGADRTVVAIYGLVALAALAGPALAEREYAEAVKSPSRAAAAERLASAEGRDPGFPLYRARRAWIGSAPATERASEALRAAADARGAAALWLRGGGLALEAGDYEAARGAFARALSLDPLSGVAPFFLYLASGGEAVDCAARALAAEPRLLAAVHWRNARERRDDAVERLASWPGLPPGFAAAMARSATSVVPDGEERVDLGLQMDVTPALSVSLHQFRRSPWVADLARIPLDRAAVRSLADLGSAATRRDTQAVAFPRDRCAPAGAGDVD